MKSYLSEEKEEYISPDEGGSDEDEPVVVKLEPVVEPSPAPTNHETSMKSPVRKRNKAANEKPNCDDNASRDGLVTLLNDFNNHTTSKSVTNSDAKPAAKPDAKPAVKPTAKSTAHHQEADSSSSEMDDSSSGELDDETDYNKLAIVTQGEIWDYDIPDVWVPHIQKYFMRAVNYRTQQQYRVSITKLLKFVILVVHTMPSRATCNNHFVSKDCEQHTAKWQEGLVGLAVMRTFYGDPGNFDDGESLGEVLNRAKKVLYKKKKYSDRKVRFFHQFFELYRFLNVALPEHWNWESFEEKKLVSCFIKYAKEKRVIGEALWSNEFIEKNELLFRPKHKGVITKGILYEYAILADRVIPQWSQVWRKKTAIRVKVAKTTPEKLGFDGIHFLTPQQNERLNDRFEHNKGHYLYDISDYPATED